MKSLILPFAIVALLAFWAVVLVVSAWRFLTGRPPVISEDEP